jgi:hypothetical protein
MNVLDESPFIKNAPNFIVYSAPEMSVSMKDTTVHFNDNDGNSCYIVVEPYGAGYWIYNMDNFKKNGGYFAYYDFTLCSRRFYIIALCPNGLDSLIEFEESWTGDDRLFPFDVDNKYIKANCIEIWKY